MTPLLVLTGPTASGKSAVAMAFASQHAVEIISVDSAQVYRGLDIGTAKPGAAERAAVPHHLIDIIEPTESYSAARFVSDVSELADAIHARGRRPLLVGGTMLYLKALRDGLDRIPASEPAHRAALDAEAATRGWPALHAELATVDPATAARLAPNDAQRIQRALEVFRSSGLPLSSFQQRQGHGARPLHIVSLEPAERGWLHRRIAERFDSMLAAGLVDELRRLRARADLAASLPAMRCVGYRQAWECLDRGELALLRERGIAATRQLAKRQLTWLRAMPERHCVACDAPDALQQALKTLAALATAERTE